MVNIIKTLYKCDSFFKMQLVTSLDRPIFFSDYFFYSENPQNKNYPPIKHLGKSVEKMLDKVKSTLTDYNRIIAEENALRLLQENVDSDTIKVEAKPDDNDVEPVGRDCNVEEALV